jgi:hypothetical protein
VLTYFASHEYVGVSWNSDGTLAGDATALNRLADLLRRSLKWYGIVCGLFAFMVLPIGLYWLSQRAMSAHIQFSIPWVLVVVFFSLGTWTIPIMAVLDGCGQIANTLKMRFGQAVATSVVVALVLLFNGHLYAVPAGFVASSVVFLVWILGRYRRCMHQLLTLPIGSGQQGISWRYEVFPMQFRVALNVISAYFQGYVIVPLLFQFRGPVEAGLMGMSMQLITSIYSLSVGWINVRVPKMGMLIGAGNIPEANRIAKAAILRAVLTSGLGFAALFAVIIGTQYYYPAFPKRMLPLAPTMVLALTVPVSVLLTGFSAYLRSYKIEPYGFPGLVVAGVNVVVCSLSAYYGSASILAYAYAGQVFFITLPYYFWIFVRRQREEVSRRASSAVCKEAEQSGLGTI